MASMFLGIRQSIATLNDRFWVPGGNPDLQPENGYTGELTIGTARPLWSGRLQVSATGYYSLLNDYVQWIPSGATWSPQNVKQVEIRGVDVNLAYTLRNGKWYGKAEGGVSFNSSIIQASHLDNDASVGKQLIYQPEFKTGGGLTIGFDQWYVAFKHRYVGEVYTIYLSSNNTLDPYHLLDVSVTKTLTVRSLQVTLIAAANNTTNTQYQNISYFPMPGTNYSLTLKLSI